MILGNEKGTVLQSLLLTFEGNGEGCFVKER